MVKRRAASQRLGINPNDLVPARHRAAVPEMICLRDPVRSSGQVDRRCLELGLEALGSFVIGQRPLSRNDDGNNGREGHADCNIEERSVFHHIDSQFFKKYLIGAKPMLDPELKAIMPCSNYWFCFR